MEEKKGRLVVVGGEWICCVVPGAVVPLDIPTTHPRKATAQGQAMTEAGQCLLPEYDVHSLVPLLIIWGLWTDPCQGEFNSSIPALRLTGEGLKGDPKLLPRSYADAAFRGNKDDLTKEGMWTRGRILDLGVWNEVSSTDAPGKKKHF